MLEILDKYDTISLAEMESVRLMNRIDTKFVTTVDMLEKLLQIAEPNYLVQDINDLHTIPYETIYYDTDKMDMYLTHQNQHLWRQKIRVRTYLDSNLTFLEIKTKNNHGIMKKKRVELSDKENLSLQEDFIRKILIYNPASLHKTLGNRFERITLVNKQKTERLTIDTGLRFHNYTTGEECKLNNLVIIELKRDGRIPSPILEVLRELHIKPLGFSKYCMGLAMTDKNLKQNNFKTKIRIIENKYNS